MDNVWQLFARGASPEEVLPALNALGSSEQFEALGERLIGLNNELRLHALSILERAESREVLGTLVVFYEDPLDEVRERSLLALYRRGGDTRAEEVISGILLEDPCAEVRAAAALALGVTRTPSARSHLLEALQDPDPLVRQKVEQQLQLQ